MAKEKAPAMQFYGREFYGDESVMVMTLEQEAAYLRLLWLCWQEGSIPGEMAKLAAICKNVPEKRFVKAIWPALAPCFVQASDGRYINRKVEEIREERSAYLERCSKGGKHSAERRAAAKIEKSTSSDLQVDLGFTCKSEPTLQSPVSSLQSPTPPPSGRLVEVFHEWIAEYPNAVRVDTAMQSWLSLVDLGEITEETLPEVFAGLRRWKESRSWAEEDGKYIPAPNVFLTGNERHNGRLWKDYPPASVETKVARLGAKKSSDGVDPNAEWVAPWQKDVA